MDEQHRKESLVQRIDDEGILLRDRPAGEPLGLELNGRRVWSFVPDRDAHRQGEEGWLVPWPSLLQPHLNGTASAVLRSLTTDDVWFEEDVTLGDGWGAISLTDKQGNPLTVDKANRVLRMFADSSGESKSALLDSVAEALELLRGHGHRAFLAFGCLLGAVREGRLIGHDSDADLVYLARPSHPFDVILESIAIERQFHAAGWRTRRFSGADFKLFPRLPGGQTIGIDVFTAFYFGDTLHVMPSVVADLPTCALLPTSTVRLEGREFPAPADPPALLEATYGRGWRVPDPAFKYETPRPVRRRLSGLMRGERKHLRYWDDFYATKGDKVPTDPSPFARWVETREHAGSVLVDVGSGNGRDSVWFSQQGFTVVGLEYARSAMRRADKLAGSLGLAPEFRRLNLYDLRQLLTAGASIPREMLVEVVYARFLVHAVEDDGRRNLWRLSRSLLRGSEGRLYLEFRTEPTAHEFGEHYRQFLQPDKVVAEVESYGFVVDHCENDYGLAVHHNEDPRVCRIVARQEAAR